MLPFLEKTVVKVPEDVDATIAIGEEKHVVVIVPRYLIHFKLELLFSFGPICLSINECDNIIFIPYCNSLTIRAPADVNVFTYKGEKGKNKSFDLLIAARTIYTGFCICKARMINRKGNFLIQLLTNNFIIQQYECISDLAMAVYLKREEEKRKRIIWSNTMKNKLFLP